MRKGVKERRNIKGIHTAWNNYAANGLLACLLIKYCCRIASRLLINQYRTRPDAKFKNIKVNMIGKNIMILAWVGSAVEGVIFCCRNMEAPMSRVSTGIPPR